MTPMSRAPLAIALLLLPSFASAQETSPVPDLSLSQTCRAADATPDRGSDACLRDERSAQRELEGKWSTIPVDVRRSCTDEVKIGGSPSYVELLTCAQMHQWAKEEPNPTAPGQVRNPGPAMQTRP